LDRSGDSPLAVAASASRAEAVKVLTQIGAKRIRGDEAQRKKAIHDQSQESLEELDRAQAAEKKLQEDIKKATRDEEIERNGHKDGRQRLGRRTFREGPIVEATEQKELKKVAHLLFVRGMNLEGRLLGE
jgi:hypothetical protein